MTYHPATVEHNLTSTVCQELRGGTGRVTYGGESDTMEIKEFRELPEWDNVDLHRVPKP